MGKKAHSRWPHWAEGLDIGLLALSKSGSSVWDTDVILNAVVTFDLCCAAQSTHAALMYQNGGRKVQTSPISIPQHGID